MNKLQLLKIELNKSIQLMVRKPHVADRRTNINSAQDATF